MCRPLVEENEDDLRFFHQRAAVMDVVLPTLRTYVTPFDADNEIIPVELSGSYFVWENWNGWATIW